MSSPSMLDAALIAGGRSRRFGSDKAFATYEGAPLYAHQLRKLARLDVAQIYLSTHADQPYPEHIEGVTRLNDPGESIGPIGALHQVFSTSQAEQIYVLAVDMPLLEPDLALPGVPSINGRWEPLAAVYPRAAMLPLLESQIAAGEYSLQRLLDLAKQQGILSRHTVSRTQERSYANLNTIQDLADITDEGPGTTTLVRYRLGSGYSEPAPDHLAVEEPLEIRVNGTSIAVMMRTPGHDAELATGFLYTEGQIRSASEILDIEHCPDVDPEQRGNTLNVRLTAGDADLSSLTRHVFTSSSCGVCGKATIDSVFQDFPAIQCDAPAPIDPEIILSLPAKLRAQQETFDKTGGLHASALFDQTGELLLLREDVGRHNALDKVIGHALREQLDLQSAILLVSGRISFELMQKALAARVPVVAGISAPSSLAVDLAHRAGVTLVGFLRERGFNLYRPEIEGVAGGENS